MVFNSVFKGLILSSHLSLVLLMACSLNIFRPKHCTHFSSESTRDKLYVTLFKQEILMLNINMNISHSIGISGALTNFLLCTQFQIPNADRISPLAVVRLLSSESFLPKGTANDEF